MNYKIIIPARLKSTRLPNKMMRDLHGKPLIEWTWKAAINSDASQVIVATDDRGIFNHLHQLGAEVIMTSEKHESGTDRLSEVSQALQLQADEIIVNWQGDEPFLPIHFVHQAVKALIANSDVAMSTLATPIDNWAEIQDPNAVKVVLNEYHEALYFSRAPIPYQRGNMHTEGTIERETPYLRHIGLYAYRASFLNEYPALLPSALEELEKLEQLRALANNRKIAVAISPNTPPPGIDTEEDLLKAKSWIEMHPEMNV